jgi:hypothetical protein
MNENSKNNHDYYLLLFQSEFNNLISTKELTSDIFHSLIDGVDDKKLENNEYMDLYLCENLFSTLLPGLESLAKNAEKLIYYAEKEDENEVKRFNPCNFLAEFLMRNNPRYGKNQETHQKFLKFTRKERKNRMIKQAQDKLFNKVIAIYKAEKVLLNKINIAEFVVKVDKKLNLMNTLKTYDWVEHFRVYKDDQKISLEEYLEAFLKAVLEIHEIDEDMVRVLLS